MGFHPEHSAKRNTELLLNHPNELSIVCGFVILSKCTRICFWNYKGSVKQMFPWKENNIYIYVHKTYTALLLGGKVFKIIVQWKTKHFLGKLI